MVEMQLESITFPTEYDNNSIISKCYSNLFTFWFALCSLDTQTDLASTSVSKSLNNNNNKHPEKIVILDYYTKTMALACASMAEYYACRCVLLSPTQGIVEFYPKYKDNMEMYRGVLLSRLHGFIKLLAKKVHTPDLLDKMDILSKHSGLLVQMNVIIQTQVVDPCLSPLASKLADYNLLTSHDAIPEFLVMGVYKSEKRDLPVIPFQKVETLDYLIPPESMAVASLQNSKPVTVVQGFDSVLKRIATTFNTLSASSTNKEGVDMIFNTHSDWISMKADIMDIIKHRQENITKIPSEFVTYCEEREQFLLFLLQ